MTRFIIIDTNSIPPVPVSRPLVSRKHAERRADKMNNEYGAYRYCIRPVQIEYPIIK